MTTTSPLKDHPELTEIITRALARYNAMTPDEKRTHRQAQQRSWVIGEMLLEHPEMTREYVERIYDEIAR